MCVDLHTHSLYSDGTDSPEQLVRLALAAGLKGLSLTDHDTAQGCGELERAARGTGLAVVNGIEISCLHNALSLHMLGYGIDPADPILIRRLEKIQEGRRVRNQKILARLREQGIRVSEKDLEAVSPRGQAGRPHIARLLVKRGVVSGMEQAFDRLLGRGRPAHVERFCYSAAETIAFIHQAGGVAVLAHPGQLDPSMRLQPPLIRELSARGLDGLEVHYPGHSPRIREGLKRLAREHRLLVTGGSDYHGGNRKNTLFSAHGDSLCPPNTILDQVLARIESRRRSPANDTKETPCTPS